MPTYHATIRLLDVTAPNPGEARAVLKSRLRDANIGRWQLVSLRAQGARVAARGRLRQRQIPPARLAPLLLVGGLMLALWLYWFVLV